MVKRVFALTGLLMAIVFTLQCTVDKNQFTGPTVDQDKYLIYKTFSARAPQMLSDGDTTTIVLELINASNEPAGNIGASFDARLGTITGTDTTDTTYGRATALYTSGAAGIDRILVSTGSKEDSLFLLIVDRFSIISLSADTTEIIADGEAHIRIKGIVKDQTGAIQDSLTLYFNTTAGTITSPGVTNDKGEINVTLTAPADSQDVVAWVTAGLQPQAVAAHHTGGSKTVAQSAQKTISGAEEGPASDPIPAPLSAATAGDSLSIRFKGITLSLLADRSELLASGIDTTRILVSINETTTHQPLQYFPFSVSSTQGGILTGDFLTDANGQASLLLTSGTVAGMATLTLAVGNRLETAIDIEFISATPTSFSLFTDASTILADGRSQSTITATVLDTLGNPVNGKTVVFSTTTGTLNRYTAQTNSQGEASVILTGDFSQNNITATVSASVAGYQNLAGTIDIVFMGVSMNVIAEQTLLVANGVNTTNISAVVFQTATNGAVVNQEVEFSTSLGTITSPGITNSSGVASATLTAGIFPGTARIIARFGTGLRDTTEIQLLNSGPNSLTLSATTTSILADGTAGSVLTATVLDTLGNPVDGSLVSFSSAIGTLDPSSTTTDGLGRATTTFTGISSTTDILTTVHSAINAGRQLVSFASVYHPELQRRQKSHETFPPLKTVSARSALEDSIGITLRGITIRATPVDPELVANGSSLTDIVTNVFETTTNNPVPYVDVHFATNLGTITGLETTNSGGVATATLISPYTAGTARIIASYGTDLRDTTTVEFLSGAANALSVNATSESLPADGISTTTVYADITDTLGNPLPNVLVQFATDTGQLSSSLITTDSEGRAAVEVTSIASATDLNAHVSCLVQTGGRNAPETLPAKFESTTSPAQAVLTDTITLQFRGLTLLLSSEDTLLVANGQSTAAIQASLFETTTFTPVTDTEITFSTTRGSITGSDFTDASGTAGAVFTSGSVAGVATIIARTGNTLTDTFRVELLTGGPRHLVLTADPSSVLADGISTVDISASLTDTLGNPVAGRSVIFSADYGSLEAGTVTSDGDGLASVRLTSTASVTDIISRLRAHIANFTEISDSLDIAFRGVSIQLSAADTILVANGEASTTLTALVTETEHNASVADAEIRFRTDLGIVTGSATTNANGMAEGILTAGIFSGPSQVIAEIGNTLRDTVTIHFVSHAPKQIVLIADESSLLADGLSSTIITGTVTDSLNAPVANATISLAVSAGMLDLATLNTNAEGQFSTTLATEPSQTDITAQLTAQVVSAPTVRDTVNLLYRGYHMNLSVSPDGISADGNSTALISIELLETTSGNPVTNKAYALSTTLGSIPAGGTTDENGQAGAILTSGTQAGTAHVLVTAGIMDSVAVPFFSTMPKMVTLDAGDLIVLGDGVATTVLTATVTDTLDNPVEGVTVNFPLAGNYAPSATGITDVQGQVQRSWSLATPTDSSARALAVLPDYSITSDTVITLFHGVVLSLTADPTSAYADGSSSVEITLTAQTEGAGNPIFGHPFSLSTDMGMITSGGTTDGNGSGIGILTNPEAATGTATITATFGELSRSTSVTFVALIPDSLSAQADVASLLADGESSAIITATVYDPSGNPAIGLPLIFSSDRGTLWPPEALTDSVGQATTTLVSEPSTVDISAQVVVQSALTPTVSDTVVLPFRGVIVNLTAANNILVADGISSTTLSAQITEVTSGNPVQNGTVNWSTTLGVVPATTVTSALGLATTTFLAGTTPGTAVVTAQMGTGLTDTVHINLSTPHDSTLVVSWYNPSGNGNNGTEQLTVTAIYADGNGYPVDSVLVNFSLDPATMGVIQSPIMTNVNGVATTTLIYSIQYAGETLRIWARNSNISGYVDVTLPEAN